MSYGGRDSYEWIKELLDVITRIQAVGDEQFFIEDNDSDILNDVEYYADTIRAELAALVEAAQELVSLRYRVYSSGWVCHECKGSGCCPERHTPENCRVAAAQAALAPFQGADDER